MASALSSNREKILVLDFGGQYNQLIARRVRDHHVYAEILPYTTPIEKIRKNNYKGIIFTGGPNSVYDDNSPHYTKDILKLGIPILGICYGCQLIAWMTNGEVKTAPVSEYGNVNIHLLKKNSLLFNKVPETSTVWMSHTDFISRAPQGFDVVSKTDNCPCAAMENVQAQIYAVQFHPEVTHSEFGNQILYNFLFEVCKCKGEWKMESFIDVKIAELKEKIGSKNVILGLSGGVDSSVAAGLLSRAVGGKLTCVFVDHGLMRKNEGDIVEKTFTSLFDMNFIRVNCKDHFIKCLKGVTDPEEKRKVIGTEFYKVFWNEVKARAKEGYFAQGTIYPDRIESGKGKNDTKTNTAVIKTHHNMVKRPSDIKFIDVVEPLADLFKDEVRKVGENLGIPKDLVWRQPFPGPGLGVRIIGEVTQEKIEILQEADWVLRDEMHKNGYDSKLSQFFCVLPGVNSVGVMGDHRTYENVIVIRAVTTDDFMTADWAKIPYDILSRVSNRITNECKHINRVVYDITSKPPGTVEWE